MRFTIKLKLGLAFGIMTLLLIGIAVYGSLSLGTLNEASGNMIAGPMRRLELALNANVAEVNAIRAQKNALLSTDTDVAAGFYKEADQNLQAMSTPSMAALRSPCRKASPIGKSCGRSARNSVKNPPSCSNLMLRATNQARWRFHSVISGR
ncbi:hypothetical protein [Rhizobium laguerreae]